MTEEREVRQERAKTLKAVQIDHKHYRQARAKARGEARKAFKQARIAARKKYNEARRAARAAYKSEMAQAKKTHKEAMNAAKQIGYVNVRQSGQGNESGPA